MVNKNNNGGQQVPQAGTSGVGVNPGGVQSSPEPQGQVGTINQGVGSQYPQGNPGNVPGPKEVLASGQHAGGGNIHFQVEDIDAILDRHQGQALMAGPVGANPLTTVCRVYNSGGREVLLFVRAMLFFKARWQTVLDTLIAALAATCAATPTGPVNAAGPDQPVQ